MSNSNRILIVDDDPMNCELLEMWLASAGFADVDSVYSGSEALLHVKDSPPDLILLDVRMPEMDGLEVCRCLKADATTLFIPIILITGHNTHQDRLNGLRAGANDFVARSVDEAELLARVNVLLENKRLYDELRATMRERIEFISQISHELRTPLFAIHGLTEMLLDGEVTQPDEVRNYLQTIYDQSGHLSRLVDDLLDLSRFERGAQTLKYETLALGPFLDDTVALMQPLAHARNIELRLLAVPRQLLVSVDEGRLRQVFINLLNNALRYNDEGGWVEIAVQSESNAVQISVRDGGWGIGTLDMPHIFRRFYRGALAQQRKSGAGGAGLGLALASEIIRAHGGTLTAQSEGVAGRGSTFVVTLPRTVT